MKTVLAIGNFDGVHKGHAGLIKHARKIADAQNLPLWVLTFEPHPRQFFKPNTTNFRLTPQPIKEKKLKALGADHVEVLAFNKALADMTATQFVNDIIITQCQAAYVMVGNDFHFGHNREGSVATLQSHAHFQTHAQTLETEGTEIISATRIRKALQNADIQTANALLGWDWEITGTVIHGDKRGRTLGYPTTNIDLGETLCPAYGIYAVRINIGDGVWRMGAASIGVRPMFEVKKPLLEVYVLDFDGDLYERTVHVQPIQKLRDEQKFDSLEALKAQMAIDVQKAKDILTTNGHE